MMNVIYILSAVIVIQSILHRFERRDLYNRIMCGDIRELRQEKNNIKRPISRHQEVMNKWRHVSVTKDGDD